MHKADMLRAWQAEGHGLMSGLCLFEGMAPPLGWIQATATLGLSGD